MGVLERANGIEPYRQSEMRYFFAKSLLAQSRGDYLSLTPQHLDQKDFEKLAVNTGP